MMGCRHLGSRCIRNGLFVATYSSCRRGRVHRSGDGRQWWSRSDGRGIEGRGIVVDGGHCKGSGVRAEFERTTKMKRENETKNDHFCEREGRVTFFSSFSSHSELHFWKMRIKMKSKMSRKWPENGYCEQPYLLVSCSQTTNFKM